MCALPNQDHVLILRAAELALPRYWQRFTSEEGIVTDADVAAFWERHGYARVESSVQAWNHVPVAVTEHNKCGCFGFHCCLLVLSLCVSVCLCVCLSVCVCLSLCVYASNYLSNPQHLPFTLTHTRTHTVFSVRAFEQCAVCCCWKRTAGRVNAAHLSTTEALCPLLDTACGTDDIVRCQAGEDGGQLGCALLAPCSHVLTPPDVLLF